MAGGDLQSAIDFNNAHADIEMPFFNQDIFELAETITLDPNVIDPTFGISYNQALDIDQNAGVNGIDAALKQFNLDAVVSATDNPAWATDLLYGDHFIFGTSGLAAPPGYPIVQVPAGVVFGVPIGISFFGTAFSEPTLIKLASGFEAATQVRAHNLPTFPGTAPDTNIQGTNLPKPKPHGKLSKKDAAKKKPHNLQSHRRYRPQDPLTTGTLFPCDLLVSCVGRLARFRARLSGVECAVGMSQSVPERIERSRAKQHKIMQHESVPHHR